MACCELPSRHLPRRTEENDGKSCQENRPRFQPVTSRIRKKNATYETARFGSILFHTCSRQQGLYFCVLGIIYMKFFLTSRSVSSLRKRQGQRAVECASPVRWAQAVDAHCNPFVVSVPLFWNKLCFEEYYVYSGMWSRVVWYKFIYVSEGRTVSILSVRG